MDKGLGFYWDGRGLTPLVRAIVPLSCCGGGPALLHSAQHVIITTAVGTPLCWQLAHCPHRVAALIG